MNDKKKKELAIRSSAAEYLTFVASTGESDASFEMRYEDENIWLTQKMMAALYDVGLPTINEHIKKIYSDGELTEERFGSYLYSAGIPDPDLLIRPGGEQRISNFLLWQIAYSEIYVTPVLWPDFDRYEFLRAILSYQGRSRRFGGV